MEGVGVPEVATMRQIGIGVESTAAYGTPVVPTRFFEFLDWQVKKNHQFKDIQTLRNYSSLGSIYSGYIAEGTAQMAANYNGIGLLLKHLIGNAQEGTATSDPWTHTVPGTAGILPADRIGYGLTLQAALESDLVWTVAGTKIESLKLNMALDQVATIDLGLVGKVVATSTTPTTATYAAFEPLQPIECFLTVDATELPATSISVEWKNPVDRPRIMRTLGLGREPRRAGWLEYTVVAQVLFENFVDWYGKLDGTTVVALVVNAIKSANRSIIVTSANARIKGEDPTAKNWDRLTVPLTLTGYFNTGATENASVVIKNGDATV